jgi:hypothetical protein
MAYAHRDADSVDHDFKTRAGTASEVPSVDVITAVPEAVLGYRRQNVGTGAGGESLEGPGGGAIPTGATHVLIDVGSASAVRMTRDNSTAPTASLGRLLPASSLSEVTAVSLAHVKLIAVTAAVDVDLEYVRYA